MRSGWAWLAILGLAGCPGPNLPDGGPGGTGALVGPCDDAGGCPAGAYCQPFLTQCALQSGVSVRLAPGNCYLENPCPTNQSFGVSNCVGTSCTSDTDCGETEKCDSTGSCCDPTVGGCSTFGSGTGGGTQPQCPAVPSPCPDGCVNFPPPSSPTVHGCPTCLCPQCPVDAG